MAAAIRWSTPTRRSAPATAFRSTMRSTRKPTTRSPRTRDSKLISASSPTGCPTGRRGSTSSSSTPPPRCRERRFLLGGSGWGDKPMPANVRYIGHVYTADHNAFNCSALAVLNVARDSMAAIGFSPATRVFEAAGAGACVITDAWEGIEHFLEPGTGDPGRERRGGSRRHWSTADARACPRGSARRHDAACSMPTPTPTARRQVESLLLNGTRSGQGARVTPLSIVILGLSITSSWGNGHATTYRALVRALADRGHDVLFLEADRPWYADNRDLPDPPFGTTRALRRARRAARPLRGRRPPSGSGDRGLVCPRRRRGRPLGDRRPPGASPPSTTSTRRSRSPSCERGDTEYLSPDLIRRYNMYLSFTGGPTLQRLERQYGSPMARALYCSVDPRRYHPEPVEPRAGISAISARTATTASQPSTACWSSPRAAWDAGRFVVAGPQYPGAVVWPANVARIEHLPPADHSAFYNAQRFTLNVTRADMIAAGWSPSVRLFEAAACGTPIISDWWAGSGQPVRSWRRDRHSARPGNSSGNTADNAGQGQASHGQAGSRPSPEQSYGGPPCDGT